MDRGLLAALGIGHPGGWATRLLPPLGASGGPTRHAGVRGRTWARSGAGEMHAVGKRVRWYGAARPTNETFAESDARDAKCG